MCLSRRLGSEAYFLVSRREARKCPLQSSKALSFTRSFLNTPARKLLSLVPLPRACRDILSQTFAPTPHFFLNLLGKYVDVFFSCFFLIFLMLREVEHDGISNVNIFFGILGLRVDDRNHNLFSVCPNNKNFGNRLIAVYDLYNLIFIINLCL
jgi:hypothetical protein